MDSSRIAGGSKRDSPAMTGIVVLIMVFLPGTFTAVSAYPLVMVTLLTSSVEDFLRDATARLHLFWVIPGQSSFLDLLGCNNSAYHFGPGSLFDVFRIC